MPAHDPVLDEIEQNQQFVITLGPQGTDASHAARRFPKVELVSSFPEAMQTAWERDAAALICAGFLERGRRGATDGWVDLHFRWNGRMKLRSCWAEPTKPMGIALAPVVTGCAERVRTVALHPATSAFADRYLPGVPRHYVVAKPLAVEMTALGQADACIGSLDVLATTDLVVVHVLRPDMVWCLYTPSTPSDDAAVAA
ncbi:hypothetical protein AB0K89_26360 [Streptomyces cinnamoneus]|uniref:hypothetical protein n=1 Tax=Streptomyces cinnamoneus TaxID=53446 RepID=UPI00341C6283